MAQEMTSHQEHGRKCSLRAEIDKSRGWLPVAVTCDHPFLLYLLLTLPSSFSPGDADSPPA